MRYDLERLAEAVGAESDAELALRLGVTRKIIAFRWAHGLTDVEADEFAIKAGLHPCSVWGRDWEQGAPDEVSEKITLFG